MLNTSRIIPIRALGHSLSNSSPSVSLLNIPLPSFSAARACGSLLPRRRFHAPNDLVSDDDGASHESPLPARGKNILDVSDMV